MNKGRHTARREQLTLPVVTRQPTKCRHCGDPAVPGLRLCRKCWGYNVTRQTARRMLDDDGRGCPSRREVP
jgi:hypothetical protein